MHCADAMIPWYETKFVECQSEISEMAEIAGLDVAVVVILVIFDVVVPVILGPDRHSLSLYI